MNLIGAKYLYKLLNETKQFIEKVFLKVMNIDNGVKMKENTIFEKTIVSVIIPTYNRSVELLKAVESVRKQTEKRIEILVCDDGSTDDTKDRIEEITRIDTRVKYLDCGHSGRPAIPRNIGIREAKGEWLAFLDDDDYWLPQKLEVQLRSVREGKQKACCTNAFCYSEGKNIEKKYFDENEDKIYDFYDVERDNPIICSSMMIHRSLISLCFGFPEEPQLRAIEDYAFWYRVSIYTKILFVAEPLLEYTICNPTSIRMDKKVTYRMQRKRIKRDFRIWLKNKPKRIRNYYAFVMRKKRYNYLIDSLHRVGKKLFLH